MDSRALSSGGARPDRPLLITFGAILLLIGAASAVFVGAYNGQRMAGLATRVQQIERALASAELTRVYIAQATYLAGEGDESAVVTRTLASADDSLTSTQSALDDYLALSPQPNDSISRFLDEFAQSAVNAIDQLRAGRTGLAADLVLTALDPAHQRLSETLVEEQKSDASEINQTSSALGRIADVVRFLLAFAIPALGMTVYRWVMNRQRKRTELQLRLESEQTINRAKDEFIANVSHELRTPLTGIVGFAQLLRDSRLDQGDLEVVNMIVDQSADLSRMVDDLLTAARADANALAINPRPVAITEEVGEVIRFLELMQTKIDVSCQEATVLVDPERFRQVLRNLLVNARKHGGSAIKVKGHIKDGSYVCSVVDDGPGVPEHVRERLFSRFVHTGEAPVVMGSVGLGLAIVRELCRLMGCEVSYRRVRGETWFSVTVPLAEVAIDVREPLAVPA